MQFKQVHSLLFCPSTPPSTSSSAAVPTIYSAHSHSVAVFPTTAAPASQLLSSLVIVEAGACTAQPSMCVHSFGRNRSSTPPSGFWVCGRGGLERVCVGSSQHTLPSTDPHTQTRHDMRQCGGDGQTRLPAAAPCRRRTRRSPAARAAAHRLPAGVHARMCVLGEERVIRRGRGVSTHMICLPP